MAALFTACKIEDTLKKSRDLLCTAHNLRQDQSSKSGAAADHHLTPDDPSFDQPVKRILGLERLMLESSGFDFRNRHPQRVVLKLARWLGRVEADPEDDAMDAELDMRPLAISAYNICCDLYRTWAPLKQTTTTMALASLELAARVLGRATDLDRISRLDLDDLGTQREQIMGISYSLSQVLNLTNGSYRNFARLTRSVHPL
jgi:CTD kinase subunit beta